MHTQSLVLGCHAERTPQFVDITDSVCRTVAESTIRNGLVTVYSRSALTAIKINENEPLLLEDLERLLVQLGIAAGSERPDPAVAAAKGAGLATLGSQSLLGSSETIPLIDGRLQFGRWQRLFFIELDRPGPREVLVQVVGT